MSKKENSIKEQNIVKERFFIDCDEQGNVYALPLSLRKEWDKIFVELESKAHCLDFHEEIEEKYKQYKLKKSSHLYSFTDLQEI